MLGDALEMFHKYDFESFDHCVRYPAVLLLPDRMQEHTHERL